LIKQQDSGDASEARCHLLGDLAARAAAERQPDIRQWAEIEQALATTPGFLRRRWLVLLVPALAGLALWIGAGLGHKSQSSCLAPDGSLSVPDDRECTVPFDDGSRIRLGKATRGRLLALGSRGAQLALQSGHADLSVVHRPDCRWEVLAGPLQVRVTGTRFEVDWAPGQGHFKLGVSQGEVSVSGGPLREPTPVRAGHSLDLGDLDAASGVPATAAAVPAAPAETAAETDAAPAQAARSERKRGAPSSKAVVRNPPFIARAATAASKPESPAATPEPASRDWSAFSVADDAPVPAAPGPRRLTVGKNGELVGGATGPVWARGGSGTRFSSPARGSASHLYLDDGLLCTRGRISPLTCVDDTQAHRCDWDTNWGVLMRWYPRADREAWGSRVNARIAVEFRGEPGRNRLVAHRKGDPDQRVYCVENYQSGRTVTPSEFKSDCGWTGGSRLPDFTQIDYFALQFLSEDTWRTFRLCLSSINLY
jgi:ferric-dicitrate binding protein FerR (iron transport regulator)